MFMLTISNKDRPCVNTRLSEQTRQYCYEEEHGKQSVTLRQIVALIDFADVKAGSEGGWVDEECALSQQGECWIYDVNSVVFAGARIRDDARLTGFCVVSHEATIGGGACIHASQISHHAQISDNVTVMREPGARLLSPCRRGASSPHCQVIAARGLTADRDKVLQIYQRATVSASRILHQAQIYGDAFVEHAFVEHRAEVFDQARLEGNEENDVWVCDNARVYGHARLIAGRGEDAIPTVR
ncbi:YdcK family protein [Klebsiella pneumoniae subsp. pneumoniae]|nr:YdcK family protein [Klebsiella pneumoniae subsp. pneumoniae]